MKFRTITILTSALCLAAGSAFAQTAAVTNAPPKSPPWDASAATGRLKNDIKLVSAIKYKF